MFGAGGFLGNKRGAKLAGEASWMRGKEAVAKSTKAEPDLE